MSTALNSACAPLPAPNDRDSRRSMHLGSISISTSMIGPRSGPLRLDVTDVAFCAVLDGEVSAAASQPPIRDHSIGSAFFCDVAEAGRLISSSRGVVLIVAAPRQVFDQIPQITAETMIAHDGGLIAPLVSFARSLLAGSASMSETAAYFAERLLQEMLLGVAVDTVRSASSPKVRDDPHVVALAMIDVRCGDASLSPAQVARECRLSLRQLERVFARYGHTVSQAIRSARLRYARQMLSDPAYDALGVDQLARHAGFSGGSSLARAMREEGWPTPTQLRTRGARGSRA